MQENENVQDWYDKLVEKFQGDHTGISERLIRKYKDQSVMVIGTKEILKKQKELLDEREKEMEGTKRLLDLVMQRQETDKFESKYGKVSYRKSYSIKILDESKVSEDYKVIKETISIDKMKIKDDIKLGKTFDRAELKENNNLQIK